MVLSDKMLEDGMDISQYEYLWENEDYEYVLVKTPLGYLVINRITNEGLLTENEKLENEIVNKMLSKGVPIYQSHKDMLDNRAPINVVGQPTVPEDFPVKRYKVYIEWVQNIPFVVQVKEFKKVFMKSNVPTNQELLDIARNKRKWKFDILYLDEKQKATITKLAEEHGLKVSFESDELREEF